MRIGLSLIPNLPIDELASVAREAEEIGFEDIWIPDHYYFRDAFAFLTLAASRTRRVRLGTAVASPFIRHPGVLASVVATLNESFQGRALLGIGPGGFEFASQLASAIEKPLTATREAIELIRALWTGRPVDYDGEVFSTRHAALAFLKAPITPDVYMAARGPRMLELAGAIADGVITHGVSSAHLRFVFQRLEQGRRKAGRDGSPSVVLMLDCMVDDDLARARDRLRPACIVMAGGSYADSLIELYGLDPVAVSRLRKAVQAGAMDEAGERVTDEMVDAFCLAGPPDRCREGLYRLQEAGVDEVIISTGSFTEPDEMRQGIRDVASALAIGR